MRIARMKSSNTATCGEKAANAIAAVTKPIGNIRGRKEGLALAIASIQYAAHIAQERQYKLSEPGRNHVRYPPCLRTMESCVPISCCFDRLLQSRQDRNEHQIMLLTSFSAAL